MNEKNRFLAKYAYGSKYSLWEKFIKSFLLFNNIELQEQKIRVMIYFCLYGINEACYERIILDGIAPSKQAIFNTKTSLRDLKLITKIGSKTWSVTEPFASTSIDDKIEILVQCRI